MGAFLQLPEGEAIEVAEDEVQPVGHVLGRAEHAGYLPGQVCKAREDVRRGDEDLERRLPTATSVSVDIREIADAVESYLTLRTAILEALYDRNVAMADLTRATGTLDGDAKLFYLERAPHGGGDEAVTRRTATPAITFTLMASAARAA